MSHRRRGDAETVTANPAEAVTGERQQKAFGRAAAFWRHGPAANLRVAEQLAACARELRFDAAPQRFAPFRHARKRAIAHAEIFHTDCAVVLEIPGTAGHALPLVEREQ